MSSDMKSVLLAARSALGTTDGVPAREVFRGAGLSIVEEDFLPIHSLRRSRAAHDETWLSRTLASVGLELPERSEEHTSELQSLMRISYAVFCLKKNNSHDKT